MQDQPSDPRTHALIGAAMEVHRHLGPGFLERIYAEALNVELARRGIEHRREVVLPVRYKGQLLPVTYRADLICYDGVLVELKAEHAIAPIHHAQVITALGTGCRSAPSRPTGSTASSTPPESSSGRRG